MSKLRQSNWPIIVAWPFFYYKNTKNYLVNLERNIKNCLQLFTVFESTIDNEYTEKITKLLSITTN